MMNKRPLCLLLVLILLLSLVPSGALADRYESFSQIYVNPLYADVVSADDIARLNSGCPEKLLAAKAPEESRYLTSFEDVGAQIRDAMESREPSVTVYYKADTYNEKTVFANAVEEAFEETGVGTQGDYLRWTYGGWRGDGDVYMKDGTCYMALTFDFLYYTTAEQEQALSERIDTVIDSFGFTDESSEYTVIKTVYDYICSHVSYDYAHLDDDSYLIKHTAYAAMMNGTAVCQGYALLMYRMLLHEGISCRVIAGMGHGWNIARIESLYYNLDSTWDSMLENTAEHEWFLKGSMSFFDHTRYSDYRTSQFNAQYPMSAEDYSPETAVQHNWDAGSLTLEPTCTSTGILHYTCTDDGCNAAKEKILPRLGHDYTEWERLKGPDCTHEGEETHRCLRCGCTELNYIEALGHSFGEWTVTKEPSCSETGERTHKCSVCKAEESEEIPTTAHTYVDGKCSVCGASKPGGMSGFGGLFDGILNMFRELFARIRAIFGFGFLF